MIVEPFGGPGGWSEGLHTLTGRRAIGIDVDADACASRRAAGHIAIRRDVSTMDPSRFASIEGLIASPPCTAFSNAGKRKGKRWLPVLTSAIRTRRWDLPVLRRQDPTIWLPLEVGRWVEATRPEWVALEQVPPALVLWEAYAGVFRSWGYSVWCGVLRSEQYGVPQTRQRAFLIASRVREVGPPTPTHSRFYGRNPGRLDEGVEKWVSMADALGWHGRVGFPRIDDRGDSADGYRERDMRPTDEPAFTLTDKARSWVLNPGRTPSQPNRRDYDLDEPAPTVAFGRDAANWTWKLNTGRDWKPGGTRDAAQKIDVDRPSPGVTHQANAWWFERPATTIAGDPRVFPPGGHIANDGRDNSRMIGRSVTKIRLTIAQALVLQSFPPDYPVVGTKTSQFRQVGNAVPPLLAAAVLRQVVSTSGQACIWRRSWRADPAAARIADRHYNRQKPGSPQFVPPGRCLVLLASDGQAVWVTSWPKPEYVRHEWPGAWINSLFRREDGPWVASDMIREAVAITRGHWPDVPDLGMVSFVDPGKVRRKRDPGRCYLKAGFRLAGETKGGLLAFQMVPDDMPDPVEVPSR